MLGYTDVYEAGDHVPEILAHRPIGLEGIDDRLVNDMKRSGIHPRDVDLLPAGAGWLLVEFGGSTREESDERARRLAASLQAKPDGPVIKIIDSPQDEERIWEIRESGLAATAHVTGEHPTWPGWEDSAVPPEKLGEYLRKLRALFRQYGYECDLYGHFGQGCVHTRIDFDLETADGVRRFREFVEHAADLVVSLGGSLSGEHGDGQARGELLPRMFPPEVMRALVEFKRIWDPAWKMNPGKVVEPYRVDENLRLGADYNPPEVQTHFQFPADAGSFRTATLRCVGVGKCRRTSGGTMCPSFMVTREEEYTTRGRARLLFEMLEGDPLTGFWQDEHVKGALDLCLACKGCKADCPVKVDMATYKAEFLSHYYEGHRRPVHAYAFGLIHYWARLASLMPRLVNLATQTPGLRDLAKLVADVPRARRIPAFAPFTFKQWFGRHDSQAPEGAPRVILWPDTFNDHFFPETAIAAVRVLERAGFRVDVPEQPLCCGSPLYDYGMLTTARRWLQDIMQALSADIEAGVSVVGLEPSCVAVFRDELVQLFPQHENAKRLSGQTYMLGEFLTQKATGFQYPRLNREAIVHGHCHHKSVLNFVSESQVLAHLGVKGRVLDSGCCGMAGSFGFEKGHYDVSMAAGERVLLPAVRDASLDTLIVADGFSCREQIAQASKRRALHLAEVLDMAATQGPDGPAGDYPERYYVPDYGSAARRDATGLIAALAVAGGLAWWFRSRRQRADG